MEPQTGETKNELFVSGYAALYDTPSDAGGWFTEVIERGAFKESLNQSDVRALINHDSNLLLARSAAGTMELRDDEKGLWFRFSIPKGISYAEDLIISIERGDITQNSFAFTIENEQWIDERDGDETRTTRVIKEVKSLYDISLVTYPFYKETSFELEKKSYEAFKQRSQEKEKAINEDYMANINLLNARLRHNSHYL